MPALRQAASAARRGCATLSAVTPPAGKWMNGKTLQDDYSPLRSVLVRHPRQAWRNQANVDAQWHKLNFLAAPEFEATCRDADALIEVLQRGGARVLQLPGEPRLGLDAIYVRDAAMVCDRGLILTRMGKPERRDEPDVLALQLSGLDLPLLGRIEGEGTLEGGDVAWVDSRTLAVARSYRTNAEGIRQLRALLGPGIELVEVPLPHWNGPSDVLHLMSFFSPIDERCAVVYSRLMPVPFRELLLQRGYLLVEVPDEEYDSLGCNVLAIAPRRVLVAEGNPRVRAALEHVGCEVLTYPGREISWKGSGGPTCLTRPLWRAPAGPVR